MNHAPITYNGKTLAEHLAEMAHEFGVILISEDRASCVDAMTREFYMDEARCLRWLVNSRESVEKWLLGWMIAEGLN